MSNKIEVSALSGAIADALKLYSVEVSESTKGAIDEVAKELVDDLRNNSPKNTGKYAKNWTKKGKSGQWIIYNKDRYRVAHLLEKGYTMRNGRRISGRKHIEPAQDRAEEKLVSRFMELLGR